MHTLGDSVGALDALLPGALFSVRARQRVGEVAGAIPSCAARAYGFECRLDNRDRVDLLYCVTPEEAHACAEPTVERLVRAWPSFVRDLWLEHDVPGARVPSVFFHLGEASTADVIALAALIDGAVPSPVRASLERLLQALPAGAVLDQVGWMRSRPDARMRCVVRLGFGEVMPWLGAIGWEGDRAAVETRLAMLASLSDYTVVNVDLGDGAPSPLGLEAHYHRRRQPAQEPRWGRLLDALVEEGLCLPAKRDGLLELPIRAADPSIWATDCILILSHVKITADEAKAYVGFLRVAK
jgi:hypothetical protein